VRYEKILVIFCWHFGLCHTGVLSNTFWLHLGGTEITKNQRQDSKCCMPCRCYAINRGKTDKYFVPEYRRGLDNKIVYWSHKFNKRRLISAGASVVSAIHARQRIWGSIKLKHQPYPDLHQTRNLTTN
jgi:hypothetical protein